jgi:septum formation protein
MRKVILASASPRRKQLLKQMGIDFQVITSDIDEGSLRDMPGPEMVKELARMKAEVVASRLNDKEIVIGADTIVSLDNKVLGKPLDHQDAVQMLTMLSGKKHTVYTGVAIIDTQNSKNEVFVVDTKIYMKDMSQKEIIEYVNTKEPLDKAGAYGIQGKGGVFVDKIEGDYFSVMGLPISKIYDVLKNLI